MTREEVLREIQRRIAEAKGYADLFDSKIGWRGTLEEDVGRVTIPRWPWDWCEAGTLWDELKAAGMWLRLESFANPQITECWACPILIGGMSKRGEGATPAEAIARCWCVWKGVDLSDLT